MMIPPLEIHPNRGVGPLRFGDTPVAVTDAVGPPRKQVSTTGGRLEYEYELFAVRFSGTPPGMTELSFVPGAKLLWRGRDVFEERGILDDLLKEDGAPLEYVGFVVLYGLGLALTGFHDQDRSQLAVTAFAPGTWDDLRARMKPLGAW
jgi:hypothetical protein